MTKGFLKENKILIILMCVFLLAGLVACGERLGIESRNKTYDIVADYNELVDLADQSHEDISYWLGQFKDELSITKIGLAEESINSLMEDSDMPVSGKVMYQVTKEADWADQYPAAFVDEIEHYGYDSFDVLVETGSAEATKFVLDAVENRFEEDTYVSYSDGENAYILIDGDSQNALYSSKSKLLDSTDEGFTEKSEIESSKIMYISLGLMPEKVEKIQSLGMEVIPRTTCYEGFNGTKFAKAVVEGYNQYGIVPEYLIAGGECVIGYDDGIDFAKDYITENDITIGLIENTNQRQNILQDGVQEIATSNDMNAVRVFSVWDYIQYRYQYYGYEGAKEIENTLFRAVTERNIRVIYFKPIKEKDDSYTYVTDIDEYKEMFTNLEDRLADHGFSYGHASVMDNHEVSIWLKILMAFGTVAAGVLLLATFISMKKKTKYIIAAVCALGAAAMSYVMPNTFELVLSFGSAVVFACLAISVYTGVSRTMYEKSEKNASLPRIIAVACGTLVACVLIALAGGIMTAGPLSSTMYMLEIDIFRGVKLAQLLPIAFFAVVFIAFFGISKKRKRIEKLEMRDVMEFINMPVKIWMVIACGIIGVVGVYYIMRTGNTSAEASTLEMLMRNFLEDHLIARPRTKEFMFAFPALMLMVYTAARKLRLWPLFFGLCAVLGMTSVCNTFMHIRSPLYLGFYRTGYSLIFGLIIGIVGILVFEGLLRGYRKLCARYAAKHEVKL